MDISVKYSQGDTVYFVGFYKDNYRILSGRVEQIDIKVVSKHVVISYTVKSKDAPYSTDNPYLESLLFATEKDLVTSLKQAT